MQAVALAQLDVDITGALIQADVGESRAAKAVEVRGDSGGIRARIIRRRDLC